MTPSKVGKVTNPTFGDQVGSRRLNHLAFPERNIILVGIYKQHIQGTLIFNGLIPIKCNLPRIMA